MLYQLSYAHRRLKRQRLWDFSRLLSCGSLCRYTSWYAKTGRYTLIVTTFAYLLFALPTATFPPFALRRESFLQLVHRPFLNVGLDLDVALLGHFNISMTQDSLYIRICDTERMQVCRKPASKAVPSAPWDFLRGESWANDSTCQIMQVERPPHLRTRENKSVTRKSISVIFQMFGQYRNHGYSTL